MHPEDSIQTPKANGCMRHFRKCCGNLPYLRCKFLKELKELQKQVSKEVCCCEGEGGQAVARVLNDNTGCIQMFALVCAALLLVSFCFFWRQRHK